MENFSQTASFIWAVADLLRGDFRQSQYGRVILPFTLLRRLECVLEADKKAVLAAYKEAQIKNMSERASEKKILSATTQKFFNTSPMSLSKLGESGIKDNLENYVQSFSTDAREIFEHFKFDEFVGLLNDANLLYKVVQKFANFDLHPEKISNHEMGLVFEELIRRFAESSNDTAGEHFTPRDIVRLTTSLVFMEDDDALTKDGIIRTIYDPTAGTGGFLSSGMEYVHELNPNTVMRAFGQELNPESYAICKADMLIKGQDVSRIKLGNTLSNDQLLAHKFDYMLSNPPFGVDWKKVEKEIKDEHAVKGFDGRFGPGLPKVSDGSLLFLMHLLSKLRDSNESGSRIGIILNGSPLFSGSAGGGESEIRRYILEADLLEAIIALPTDMFYNTGIATYVWILSNKKDTERRGKVQLINASDLSSKMQKSLGSKRKKLTDQDIRTVTQEFGSFGESNSLNPINHRPISKVFATHEFGYRRITIERPLRLSVQFSNDNLYKLRFAPKPFNTPMKWIWEQYGKSWTDENYGDLSKYTTEIRAEIKERYPDLKEKQIKDLLDKTLWLFQRDLLDKAIKIQGCLLQTMGAEATEKPCNDFNFYDLELKKALKTLGIRLEAREKKQLKDAVSWRNPEALPVIKKVIQGPAQPKYGSFDIEQNGKSVVVEFQADGDLRDSENVPLDPSQPTQSLIEHHFECEVAPHVSDAWIDANKCDEQDNDIGIVGYEIPFNRHFYVYKPPRNLMEIDSELDQISGEILSLLEEVHS